MEKTDKMLLILLLILVLFLVIFELNLDKNHFLQKYGYTKAICDEKGYCENFFIECDGKETAKLTPTGYSIQIKNNKQTPIEDFCT